MPSVSAALLSDARVLAAYLIFLGSYIVFALGKFPGLKIDRPGAAIIGATLMVAFRIVDAQTALGAVDFATMVLLFSMMLVVSHVRVGGLFDWIAALVIRKLRADHLLGAVVIATGVLSAFLVNDIVCLVMTPMVINLTRRLSLPPLPYLLAVASASNIGSVATITGNPQNMLIGSLSHIPYVSFMARLGPVAVVGLLASWIIIHLLHRTGHVTRTEAEAIAPAIVSDQKLRAKPIIVLALVLAGFLGGAPPALAASVGAAVLLISRSGDPGRVYAEVDWGLLVFFVGLFVIVAGAERAGLTTAMIAAVSSSGLHRLPLFVTATAVLSNIVSNVPAVMLLRGIVPDLADPHTGWLALAMSSTLAGNLTITGSVANIIVVERARAEGVDISFGAYFRVGLPVTVATLVLGSAWLWITG
jgi:Na+/H+ antiporter NhaD/arsenite permease-like protein